MSITDVLLNNFLNMRMNVLKSIAFASMLAMAACSTDMADMDGDRENALSLGPGEDIIRISMTNTTSRAARPIGSSEALNNVNRIAFKFLTNGTTENGDIKLEGIIGDSGETLPDYAVEGNVLKLLSPYKGTEIKVKFSGMTKGSYKIIAYGYNYTNGTDGSDAFPYSMALANDKGSNMLYKVTGVTTAVQEIFAGCNEGTYIGVNEFGKFETVPTITLTRQVAGLLAYFKNAPVYVNNTKVAKVTVSSKANVTGFYFPASMISGTGFKPEYNGALPSEGDWHQTDYIHLLSFNMSKASNYNDEHLNNGDCYKFNNSYLLADDMTAIEGLECQANTLFGSRFLVPFPAYVDFGVDSYNCATLNICYWDADGKLILSVPLRNGGDEKPLDGTANYQYGIKCNNFYSIGEKTKLEGDPDDPDEPIDIQETTGYDHANVSISDDWDANHNLVN